MTRLFLLSLCFVAPGVWAKDKPVNIEKVLKSYGLKPEAAGFYLWDLDGDKMLLAHQGEKAFIPASVSKLPAMLFALETLGPDHRFETRLGYTGKITKGKLKGDLVLKGGGDPFLTHAHLFNFVRELRSKGVKEVTGKFYVDESALPKIPLLDPNGEKDQPYNPGLGALSSEFNRFTLLRNGRYRSAARSNFETIPKSESLKVKKTKELFEPGLRYRYKGNPKEEIWEVSTRHYYPRREQIPVREPAIYTGGVLRHLASLEGIKIPAPQIKKIKKSTKELMTNKSKKVLELVEDTLEYSNNVLAELLLLTAARKENEKVGGLEEAAKEASKWMQEEMKGDWKDFNLQNGSGMTSKSRVSPRQIVEVLKYGSNKKYEDRFFWSLLSISGWKGWMERRLRSSDLAFRAWAKTGSLDYASGLAGYLLTGKGKRLAFGIFMLDAEKRSKIDTGGPAVATKMRKHALRWRDKAHQTQDALLKHWIETY